MCELQGEPWPLTCLFTRLLFDSPWLTAMNLGWRHSGLGVEAGGSLHSGLYGQGGPGCVT